MCTGGGGGGSYEPPKVDPTPTVVESPVQNGDREAVKKQRRRVGSASNALSTDRGTILGSAMDALAGNGTRRTFG